MSPLKNRAGRIFLNMALKELERKAAQERQKATRAPKGERIGGGKLPPPIDDLAMTRRGFRHKKPSGNLPPGLDV